jgi:hypothetical protein
MKRKKFEEEWIVTEKFAEDTPEARASLDEGLRILARMILRRMRADREAEKFPKEIKKNDDVVLNYEI